jgi:hypothetical protein
LGLAVDIVETFAKLDSERAYHSAARLVQEINQAGVSQSGPGPYHNSPDLAIASKLLSSRSFTRLAEADFGAALALAQSIVRLETSNAAQLAVCRSALSKAEQTSQNK